MPTFNGDAWAGREGQSPGPPTGTHRQGALMQYRTVSPA